MSGMSRERAARRVLWSLGMRGQPEQVKLLLYLLENRGEFSAPGLMLGCGLPRGRVYYFVAMMRHRGVIVPGPRPVEPEEWAENYGIGVRRKMRRENNLHRRTPLTLDLSRLRALVAESCDDSEVLAVFGEAVV